jgi:hypothetical protein
MNSLAPSDSLPKKKIIRSIFFFRSKGKWEKIHVDWDSAALGYRHRSVITDHNAGRHQGMLSVADIVHDA